MEKLLPIGIQSFKTLIENNYLYIDKTKNIHNLITTGKYYFLSRPRRFGKSLLISILKEIFSGNKEFFKGLWIYDKIEWEQYQVIKIDFSRIDYKNQNLNVALGKELNEIAKAKSIELKTEILKEKFRELIEQLSKKNKVVLLIDEYDKPIIDYIDDIKEANKNRDILKNFYSTIKPMDEYLKFVFLAGVSKFSKVSIFSDLNNLEDITLGSDYANLLGYTEDEILKYFSSQINDFVQTEDFANAEEVAAQIRKFYNGYSWDGTNFVYNPFSVLNLFKKKSFGNYWFATGTPTFLIKSIRNSGYDITTMENKVIPDTMFNKFVLEDIDIDSLLFQTGYLTIKEKKKIRNREYYVLGFPNLEVSESLDFELLESYSYRKQGEFGHALISIENALFDYDIEQFIKHFLSLFSAIPNVIFQKNVEGFYQTIVFITLRLLGLNAECEVQTNLGRIDAVIKTDKYIYIVEFKMGKAETAIKQIKEKHYYQPYISDKRQVILFGVGFDKEKKNIGDWLVEKV